MDRPDALARATQILLAAQGQVSAPEAAELTDLEEQFPGVTGEAAVAAAEAGNRGLMPRSPCELVDVEASFRWGRLPDKVDRPEGLSELVAIMEQSKETGRTLKAVGAARSISDVGAPRKKGGLLASCALDKRLELLHEAFADGVQRGDYYRCESGRTAKDVIDDLQDGTPPRALINMGAGQFQGIVGAVATGTHGSGLGLQDLSGFVMAAQIITYDDVGEVACWQLAREGFFDPEKFEALQADRTVKFTLIEDDDLVDAASVGMGCLGLVYSVTIKVVPQYWLHESRTTEPWQEVKQSLLEEAGSIRNYEVLISPFKHELDGGGRDHLCLVTRRRLVTKPEDQHKSGHRSIAFDVASSPVGRIAAGIALLHTIRDPVKRAPRLCETSVSSTTVESYTDISRKVLQLNLDLNSSGNELHVRAEDAVAAADALIAQNLDHYNKMKAAIGDLERPYHEDFEGLTRALRYHPVHTTAISLRFVKQSPGWLSMAHGQDNCAIEAPMPGSDHFDKRVEGHEHFDTKERQLYAAYTDGRDRLFGLSEALLRERLGARAHWGLFDFETAQTAEASYARWDDWLALYQQSNRHGVFNNAYTDQLGISVIPKPTFSYGDAVVGRASWQALEGGRQWVLALEEAVARSLFDNLTQAVSEERGNGGRTRVGLSYVACSRGRRGRVLAELRFGASGLLQSRPQDTEVHFDPKLADATKQGKASLANGVLVIAGGAGAALHSWLAERGVELPRTPDKEVWFDLHNEQQGRLGLLL